MIDNLILGRGGFIGSHLVKKLAGRKLNTVFYLAAYGNRFGQNDLGKMLDVNVTSVAGFLTYERCSDCSTFLFMSSSSVHLPFQTPYSLTKRAAEEMIQASDLPWIIIRPYSVTGVGEQKEHLIPTLIRSCLSGEPMDFVPDATHDFIDVEDVVNAMLILTEKRAHGTFEIGSGNCWRNSDVKDIVETITGKQANIRNLVESMRPYDTDKWVCDDHTAEKFGWYVTKTLHDSITEMVEDYE